MESHPRHAGSMIEAWFWQTADSHVAIADRLDLFNAQFLGEFIKLAEQTVEHLNDIACRCMARECGKADNVSEKYRHFGKSIRYLLFAVLKARGNLAGKNIEQQSFILSTLLLD